MKIFEILKKFLYRNETLDFGSKIWPMKNCYDCGCNIEGKDCWYKFVYMGKQIVQVPQCDDCIEKERLKETNLKLEG